jgi:hypothetical protein
LPFFAVKGRFFRFGINGEASFTEYPLSVGRRQWDKNKKRIDKEKKNNA